MNPFDPELLEALMIARMNNPGMFQSFWELDEQGVEEESEEEIQKDPKKKILWAAENNYLDIAKSLLEEDPSLVNSRDSDLYTPLHRACYNGHTGMVKFLIDHNADIEAQTEDGWHPIHSAARWNQAEVISVLLERGADINARTNSGLTPLHLASSEKENGEAISLLLSNCNLNTEIRNSLGETAEDICSRTSEHCKLFEERRKRLAQQMTSVHHQGGSMDNVDHPEGNQGNLGHLEGNQGHMGQVDGNQGHVGHVHGNQGHMGHVHGNQGNIGHQEGNQHHMDHLDGNSGHMNHMTGSGSVDPQGNFDYDTTETEDLSGEVLNLSDNVAQGFEDLYVSMDTYEKNSESDQFENNDQNHYAMDENP
ncbi:poly [ADP-ribose] polymerase tankyrase-2-like isoform X1 [Saccostrea cucullata]|uniref:poly [ADP-ribose] polymerase tankyrase-2-like isoform X1 n=1 Tax=Saccostrea cuccullata TaxID=36930 RepID=UPI002ED3B92C